MGSKTMQVFSATIMDFTLLESLQQHTPSLTISEQVLLIL